MKGVISYRTDFIEDLKKIAKIRNVSLSTITGEIVKDFVHNDNILRKYDLFSDGKKFISAAFESLDPSTFDKIILIGVSDCTRCAKMSMNHFSLEDLLVYFRGWIEMNGLELSEFDENERIRWRCETNMGKNYNEICAKCFKMVLENFGIVSNVESSSYEDFEIVFLKKTK